MVEKRHVITQLAFNGRYAIEMQETERFTDIYGEEPKNDKDGNWYYEPLSRCYNLTDWTSLGKELIKTSKDLIEIVDLFKSYKEIQ